MVNLARPKSFMMKNLIGAVALLVVWGLGMCARAHGDFHSLIVEANQAIEKSPNDPEVYLRRGEVYRLHQQWEAAAADYNKAEALGATQNATDLARGRLYSDTDWPLAARASLDRFLASQSGHVEALTFRGRALLRLGQPFSAAADFSRAIAASTEPGPELFIERAQILASAGADQLKTAVAGLDEGIQKLGPLVTLQLKAMDLELKEKNYDAAIARIDLIAAKSPRKETWQARRGEILLQANRPEEAKAAFQAALKSMDTLPPARRNVPAVRDLESRVRRELDHLGGARP